MQEQSVIHHTFVIERAYSKAPECVFAAFADAAKKRRWFVEGEHNEVEHFEMDFRVGGSEVASYRLKGGTPYDGALLSSESHYFEIVPNRLIVSASWMALAGRRISAALVTFEFLPASGGTDVLFTHQAAFFEGSDGPAMREAGWRKLLDRLATELTQQ
jgi:uncharacterized protein YndB with AHSA1/START domain